MQYLSSKKKKKIKKQKRKREEKRKRGTFKGKCIFLHFEEEEGTHRYHNR